MKPKNRKGTIKNKAQDQMKRNHQHIERRLLGGSAKPGERGDAREIDAVGGEQCEADQDDPEKRAQTGPDGRRVSRPLRSRMVRAGTVMIRGLPTERAYAWCLTTARRLEIDKKMERRSIITDGARIRASIRTRVFAVWFGSRARSDRAILPGMCQVR